MYFALEKYNKPIAAIMVFLLAYYMSLGVLANEKPRAGNYVGSLTANYPPTDIYNPIYTQDTGRGVSMKETSGLFSFEPKMAMISTERAVEVLQKEWNNELLKKYSKTQICAVTKGVKHVKLRERVNGRYVNLNVIEINKTINPNLVVMPATASSSVTGKRGVKNIVSANGAILGVNGTFFKPQNGIPLGALKVNGELITGPIYNRVGLGVGDNNYYMSKIAFDGNIQASNGEKIKIDNINQPRMLASYTLIYSDKWGKTAPISPKYGMQIKIENNVVTEKSTSPLSISNGGYVIVGPAKELNRFKINERINLSLNLNPEWQDVHHVISGGPYLVKDGQPYVDYKEQNLTSISGLNPRTAIGYTDTNVLIIVTVDGRQENSSGVSLWELAKIMKKLGCINAMNLDGGGSSQMVLNGKFVNRPTEGGARSVSNAIILKEMKSL